MIKGSFTLLLIAGVFFTLAASESDVIAEIDGIPLKVSDLAPESRRILANNSSSRDVSDISLKAAIDLEVKLRTTLELLKSQQITADAATAAKYISDRCKNYPVSGKLLQEGLTGQLNDRKFQLKCAIYYFVCAKIPELKDVSAKEAENFYRANLHLFRRATPGEFTAVRVSNKNPDAVKIINNIRTALLQGQNIHSAAESEKLTAEKAGTGITLAASKFKLKKNGVSPVFECGSDLVVAVCTQEGSNSFAPLENVDAFIAEELLSRRCGAAFDEILKREISRKQIKYRR